MASVHVAYRRRLALLADDAAILGAMGEWSAGRAQDPPQWQRTYGRFLPASAMDATPTHRPSAPSAPAARPHERRPYAIVVFERMHPRQEIRTVELYDVEPDGTSYARVVEHAELGWLAESRFPSDRRLPTLADALARAGDGVVVRYRPGRRCTFRVDRIDATFFCKVFPDDTGRRLHEEAQQLWAASERGELGFAVAEPVAWDADTRTLWQRSVGGVSIGPLLAGADALDFARRLGHAAGTIVSARITPGARFDSDVQCERSHSYARELSARVPALTGALTGLMATLESVHRDCGARQVPIHGAPHMNQWLGIGRGFGLVDFDRLSTGDPELDVATFLGELDFEDGLTCSMDDIAPAFIAGYEESAGPLDPRLLAAYRAHKRLAKALRSARALRPDGDVRAERHLGSAVAALDDAAQRSPEPVTWRLGDLVG
ncbi:MAG: phosphotransferase [Vicinamibacterales bacterium]